MNTPDYTDFVAASTTGELAQLQQLADEQLRLEALVAGCELQLSKAKDQLKNMAEVQLPEAMDAVGMTEFKTRTGLVIRIAETIRASIPKARSGEAFVWLKEHGQEAMIKSQLTIAFGKGEEEKSKELYAELLAKDFHLEASSSVHPATLSSWAKEKLEQGDDIPLELFGVFRQRVAKLSTK